MISYFDIHAHLHDRAYDGDRSTIISNMEAGEIGCITIGTDLEESKRAVDLAEKHTHIFASVGRHPVDNKDEVFDLDEYEKLIVNKKTVAVGECGLDYYWPKKDGLDIYEEKKRQTGLFKEQINLSIKFGKPLMVHGRPSPGSMDAYDDIILILKKFSNPRPRGNVHFFAGNETIAKKFLNLGFTMSFTGVITFVNDYDSVILYIPMESILAETDAPYVSPAPFRGKRNDPTKVTFVVKRIASIKGISEESARRQLLENAKNLFALNFE